jgi:hypothetical protein
VIKAAIGVFQDLQCASHKTLHGKNVTFLLKNDKDVSKFFLPKIKRRTLRPHLVYELNVARILNRLSKVRLNRKNSDFY